MVDKKFTLDWRLWSFLTRWRSIFSDAKDSHFFLLMGIWSGLRLGHAQTVFPPLPHNTRTWRERAQTHANLWVTPSIKWFSSHLEQIDWQICLSFFVRSFSFFNWLIDGGILPEIYQIFVPIFARPARTFRKILSPTPLGRKNLSVIHKGNSYRKMPKSSTFIKKVDNLLYLISMLWMSDLPWFRIFHHLSFLGVFSLLRNETKKKPAEPLGESSFCQAFSEKKKRHRASEQSFANSCTTFPTILLCPRGSWIRFARPARP